MNDALLVCRFKSVRNLDSGIQQLLELESRLRICLLRNQVA